MRRRLQDPRAGGGARWSWGLAASLPAGGVRHMLPEVIRFRFGEGGGVGRARGGLWILIVCFVCSLLYY